MIRKGTLSHFFVMLTVVKLVSFEMKLQAL